MGLLGLYFPWFMYLKEFGVVGSDMYTQGIKDFHKCWSGSLAKRRLCLGPVGVINCTPLSALSFWLSLFPGMHGYNTAVVVQLLSCVQLFVTPWTAAHQASLSFTISRSLLKLMPLSRWCHLSHPLSSPSPPTFNLSQHQGLFKWVSFSHQMAKVLEFQLQHQSFCCSHVFPETNSLRRTMQIVECSLLHRRAQGRVSS